MRNKWERWLQCTLSNRQYAPTKPTFLPHCINHQDSHVDINASFIQQEALYKASQNHNYIALSSSRFYHDETTGEPEKYGIILFEFFFLVLLLSRDKYGEQKDFYNKVTKKKYVNFIADVQPAIFPDKGELFDYEAEALIDKMKNAKKVKKALKKHWIVWQG